MHDSHPGTVLTVKCSNMRRPQDYRECGGAADLRSLARLIPATSRLLLRAPVGAAGAPAAAQSAASPATAADGEEAAQVPTASVRAGDMLLVRSAVYTAVARA